MIKTEYRTIKTKIPHPKDLKLFKELDKVEPNSMHNQLPIVWKEAKDFNVWDRHGNKFIDFSSGIFFANAGHSNTYICNAIRRQVNTNLLSTYSFPTEIRLEYLKALTKFTGFEKAFLLSAGTEATEAVCKIMRESTKRNIIFSFKGAMHGKTFFAEALKGNEKSQYVYNLEYPKENEQWKESIKNINTSFIDNCAGIIIESYRGWDAKLFSTKYIQDLVKWALSKKILVCFDEIQAGWGRTGKLFAYKHYRIKPDLVCCGKGLGGGVPISCVLGSKTLLDTCDDLSSTNSANPLVCSAALANLEYFKKYNLVKESERKGKILSKVKRFINYDGVTGINQKGMVAAIIFKNKEIANKVCMKALQNGVIVIKTGRESIKLGMPLTIEDEALKKGISIIEEAIKNWRI
jgi:4-aminobutyrate aminotransferase-like enzyme